MVETEGKIKARAQILYLIWPAFQWYFEIFRRVETLLIVKGTITWSRRCLEWSSGKV